MSGQHGNRGYLIQSIIALLESLTRSDWDRIVLEPDHELEKIDILWLGPLGSTACQVKSSVNPINKPDVERWASDLESQSTAERLSLILVGPCSGAVAKMKSYGKVDVPCPKNLDFEGLLGFAAHLLDKFLVDQNIDTKSAGHRELIVCALVTQLSVYASKGVPVNRDDFVELLRSWTIQVAPPQNLVWELVDFSHQRGIENAIAGKRLGPADVEACPEFPICNQVVKELKRSHWYSIIGQSGCGKSITAWQAAKKLNEQGYSIWRPNYDAKAKDLLSNLPSVSRALLVIDDAQQFESGFIERLSEKSCDDRKTLLTSTLANIVSHNPACISPTHGVDILKTHVLERRSEILPIVQRFDDDVGDRYMDVTFERRVNDCARQNSPWEFFWVLRGGWRTARTEYESLKQVDHANLLITAIAVWQICSCDAGISLQRLIDLANDVEISGVAFEKSFSHLVSLGLVFVVDDVVRTKHINYAYRIIYWSLCDENQASWASTTSIVNNAVLSRSTSLKGVYWLFDAIQTTDATRFQVKQFQVIVEPLLERCRNEWRDTDWAVGCTSFIYCLFEFSIKEMELDKLLFLEWLTAGTGRIAKFSSKIANHLINQSDRENQPETSGIAKEIFEQVNVARLVQLANSLELDDFYSFGELLDRLAFYRPTWSEKFISRVGWQRTLKIILDADAGHTGAVSAYVGSLSKFASKDPEKCSLRFVKDIAPYIVRSIQEDPIHAIEYMHEVFWHCLGFVPRFLRIGNGPDDDQLQVTKSIFAQLDPVVFAKAMCKATSREMEYLARSLSVINEVDGQFTSRIAIGIEEEKFHSNHSEDWRNQNRELLLLLRFFCIGSDLQPARGWITANRDVINEPLQPMLAGIAPKIAIEFHKNGKHVSLIGYDEHRWNDTVWAIHAIAKLDRERCIEIIEDQLDELEGKLYVLSFDSPKHIVLFFRLVHDLSVELFSKLVKRINLQDNRIAKLVRQLTQSQPNERVNYEKLARLAQRAGGELGNIGHSFLRLLIESETQEYERG